MNSPISVSLGKNSYKVTIAPASLPHLGSSLNQLELGKKILVISNDRIFAIYGNTLFKSLQSAGFEIGLYFIPEGERYKTLKSITQIYNTALRNRLERSSTMLALGGGVIGDMTGFAAATWLRGINFVQVPTSLLAMVDASIGGKTGVNHPQGKNLIGAFYQPRLVFIDPLVLKTLSVREFRAGMAEVIKYGVIWDEDLFTKLEQSDRLDNLAYISEELLQIILTRSCKAKVDVVNQDEKEDELRAILNYGHTIGHAIESLTKYNTINHGEAVAMGMVAAGKIAVKLNMWRSDEAIRQDKLIEKAGLLTTIPASLDSEAIIDLLQMDKKVKDEKVRFILPPKIGKAKICKDIPSEIIKEVLEEIKH